MPNIYSLSFRFSCKLNKEENRLTISYQIKTGEQYNIANIQLFQLSNKEGNQQDNRKDNQQDRDMIARELLVKFQM